MRDADGDVDLLGHQIGQPVFHHQRDLDLRMLLRECRQQGHEVALAQRPRAGNTKAAAHLLLELAGDLLDVGQRAVDLLGLQQHRFTDFGERETAGRALDQPGTQVGFQLGELTRYHRLAAAQPRGGLADAAGTDDG